MSTAPRPPEVEREVDDEETPFDADKGRYLFASGKKGSGKSVLVRRYWDGYPYDKIVIDPTKDVREDLRNSGVEFVSLTDPLPVRLPKPAGREGEPHIYVFCPDMGSPTAIDDMDRVTGLALANGKTGLWIDEIGAYSKAGQTPPNLARALHYGRHDQLTLLMAGPRPKNIDPLCISQADYVATFHTPNPMDRERIADNVGIPRGEFDDALDELGRFEYLWFDAGADSGRGILFHRPALPPRRNAVDYYVPRDQR